MSKSAGTLQTTNQATYIPPRLMPGYKGHCPGLKFDYGETYGNATAKQYQDYRSETLNTSKSAYAKGGQFPTVYTHNPDRVISSRDRTRERHRVEPKYSLANQNYDRKEELLKFDQLAQAHREHYKDRTGTAQRVDEFLIPKSAAEMYRMDGKVDDVEIVDTREATQGKRVANRTVIHRLVRQPTGALTQSRQSTVRDRAMRDVHFESR